MTLIMADGVAVVAAVATAVRINEWLHGEPDLFRSWSGTLSVPDMLVALLVAMFAVFAVMGRYVERPAVIRNEWRLVVFASFCVALLEGVQDVLAHHAPVHGVAGPGLLADPGVLLAVFPLFPVFAILGHRAAETLLELVARPPVLSVARLIKGVMDVTFAGLLLVMAIPVFLAIMAASWLEGGPVFFAHRRIGAGGRPFGCLKFRTMMVDCDHVLEAALAGSPALAQEWEASRKLVLDPRVTRLGKFLRSTSLDELPQLINVLRREMSLVGPRPIVESEVGLYGEDIAHYYAVRPGLTGLWQVSGRSGTTYARRVQLDVWYVNNWTIRYDLSVLLKTIPVVLRRQGAC